jgi:phenylglyoxylate dehydrogenase delta subunit
MPTWFEANLEICKGCGVCAEECPHRAITMAEEIEE